jgi:hypothetical protein
MLIPMYIYYTYSVCHQYFKIYHCKSLNYYNIFLTIISTQNVYSDSRVFLLNLLCVPPIS